MVPDIRSAQLSDAPAILALWVEADAEPTHTDTAEHLQGLIRHDPAAVIVAESGGRIVGSVIAGWDGWRGSVYRLAVSPEHQRQGLGRRLVMEAERRLSSAGAFRLQAIVVGSDPRATGFWRSAGWGEQVDRVRFVKG